jgi:4-hydroxybenzoate polyprenyltransferase
MFVAGEAKPRQRRTIFGSCSRHQGLKSLATGASLRDEALAAPAVTAYNPALHLLEPSVNAEPTAPPLLLSYLRLLRIPNVFTALADVLMGYAVVQQSFKPVEPLLALLVASACLYLAGMVLNDVFDVEEDRRERPQRPIPSGRIPLSAARGIGFALLVLGLVAGAGAGYLPQASAAAYPWRSAAVAVAIAASVLLYDGVLKRTMVGPVFMGLCRFFNVLLGASLADQTLVTDRAWTLYFNDGQLLAAGAIGVYVLGITIFARAEATQSQPLKLSLGLAVQCIGIALLYFAPQYLPVPAHAFSFASAWPLLLLLLALSIGRHSAYAIADPQPAYVQRSIKFAILSIITLDAALTLYLAGPPYGMAVFALMIPALVLGQWVYST